jgi:hypothetical protein
MLTWYRIPQVIWSHWDIQCKIDGIILIRDQLVESKQTDDCWKHFRYDKKKMKIEMRIDKLMIPFVLWTFWLFDVLVVDLIIGHYLSWTSIFNLFFIEMRQKWLLFELFCFSLKIPEEGERGGFGRRWFLWVSWILCLWVSSSMSMECAAQVSPRLPEKRLKPRTDTKEFLNFTLSLPPTWGGIDL